MKRKLKNITVPYLYYNKRKNHTYYIYKDQEYRDIDKLFLTFVGTYLTYHYCIKDKEREVHNLSEVIFDLIKHKDTFSIPSKYKKEYSTQEYHYLNKLQKHLQEKKLQVSYNKINYNHIKNHKLSRFTKRIYEEYKDTYIPQYIYSKEYDNYYYVVSGSAFENIYQALDEVFDEELYYEFGGNKRPNNRSHSHCHNFDQLIYMALENSKKFKIHLHQQQYYSEQELIFLDALAKKLNEMKFHSIVKDIDITDSEEYIYLKENKKIFSLIIYNLRTYLKDQKYQREVLNSHKI